MIPELPGCVLFLDRYEIHKDGTIYSRITNKALRPGPNSKGYLTVSLYNGSIPKKPRSYLVHRLVAEAYLGKSDLTINHKNGDKRDNRVENLEYMTIAENNQHAVEVLGKNCVGENNPRSRLTDEQVQEIRASNKKSSELAKQYGISRDYVRQIIRGVYRKVETPQ